MWTATFWKDAAERAVKTAAQTAGGVLVVGVPIWEVDWTAGLGITATATALSLLTSIASSGRGDHESASALEYVGRHRAG
ncbi:MULTISPECIES: holin [unclassified Dietzia]|uniref:holin n=1 Tax=unclassified Dietzia TaxID=2617939 RepID=UPI0015F810C2|nr:MULTISPECIES: holin [unclassified Dietzia]MBB1023344.1 holin [Dietzia sp. DQ12-76]MBB1027525.1 holin [Dietzia sp. DQ11-38-2]